MSRPRRLEWGVPRPAPPKRPYRDTVIVYAALALVIVVVAVLTGGSFTRALVFAVGFFVIATSYGLVQWRRRLRRAEDERRTGAGLP